jgi:hypothetical protein
MCRWHATHWWKALDKIYNFVSYLISIRGLHTKLWGPKVTGILTLAISGLPFGSPGTKSHLDVGLVERHKVYYKGEGGGFPQVRAVVSLVSPSLPVARPSTKSALNMHWPLCVGFMQVRMNSWCLSLFLVPSQSSSTSFYPSKCYKPGNMPQLLACPMSLVWTHLWVH